MSQTWRPISATRSLTRIVCPPRSVITGPLGLGVASPMGPASIPSVSSNPKRRDRRIAKITRSAIAIQIAHAIGPSAVAAAAATSAATASAKIVHSQASVAVVVVLHRVHAPDRTPLAVQTDQAVVEKVVAHLVEEVDREQTGELQQRGRDRHRCGRYPRRRERGDREIDRRHDQPDYAEDAHRQRNAWNSSPDAGDRRTGGVSRHYLSSANT